MLVNLNLLETTMTRITKTAVARERTRTIDLTVEVTPEEELRKLTVATYKANKEANAAKNNYDKTRSSLLAAMGKHSRKHFVTGAVDLGGGAVSSLEAEVKAPEGNDIDVSKLRTLVTDDVFMKIIKATQSSVEAHAGKTVLAQCLIPTKGEPNVSVKVQK